MILKPNMSAIPTPGTWRAGSPGPKTTPARRPAFEMPSDPLSIIIQHPDLAKRRRPASARESYSPDLGETVNGEIEISASTYAGALPAGRERNGRKPPPRETPLPEPLAESERRNGGAALPGRGRDWRGRGGGGRLGGLVQFRGGPAGEVGADGEAAVQA